MSGVKDLQDISKILHIARSTVGNYLKAGVEFGWCDYDPNWTKIPVKLIDNNELVVQIFPSINECVRYILHEYGVKLDKTYLKKCCQTHKPYKGFNFRFKNDTIQNY